jgi:hypothetical protein
MQLAPLTGKGSLGWEQDAPTETMRGWSTERHPTNYWHEALRDPERQDQLAALRLARGGFDTYVKEYRAAAPSTGRAVLTTAPLPFRDINGNEQMLVFDVPGRYRAPTRPRGHTPGGTQPQAPMHALVDTATAAPAAVRKCASAPCCQESQTGRSDKLSGHARLITYIGVALMLFMGLCIVAVIAVTLLLRQRDRKLMRVIAQCQGSPGSPGDANWIRAEAWMPETAPNMYCPPQQAWLLSPRPVQVIHPQSPSLVQVPELVPASVPASVPSP